MGISIGIDLGSTKSVIAVARMPGESPRLLQNEIGEVETPAVLVEDENGEFVVGRRSEQRHSIRAVFGAKPCLEDDTSFSPSHRGKIRARDAVSILLKDIKTTAEQDLGDEVDRATIGVPLFWNSKTLAVFRDAAKRAGFERVQLVPEPVAAVMACYTADNPRPRRVLTYDLGGGKFEAAVIEIRDGQFIVNGTSGDGHIGGCKFDGHLAKLFWEQLREIGYDLPAVPDSPADDQVYAQLLQLAEQTKIRLSFEPTMTIHAPLIGRDRNGKLMSVDAEVHRAQFEEMIATDVDRTFDLCKQVLDGAGLTIGQLDDVMLLGGSSRIPCIRQRVSEELRHEPSQVHPQHCVALGAARLTADRVGIESTDSPPLVSLLTSRAISAQVGEDFSELVPAGIQLPFETTLETVLAVDGAASELRLPLFEGGTHLGVLVSKVPQGVPSGSPVQVTLTIDTERHISAEVHFLAVNQRHQVDLQAAPSDSQPTLQEILERSMEFANEGDFRRAEGLLLMLPDDPAEVMELKRNFLTKLEEAEAHREELRERVENVVRAAKRLAKQGRFREARSTIDQLPNHPAELVQVKGTLYEQLTDAETKFKRAVATRRERPTLALFRNAERYSTMDRRIGSKRPSVPDFPGHDVDLVHFSVTSPTGVERGATFILDLWAHFDHQQKLVLERAKEARGGRDVDVQSKGPVKVTRGTVLSVQLRIDGLVVPDPQDTILWQGEIGNARFQVKVPQDASPGECAGMAGIYADGMRIAKLYFGILVTEQTGGTASIPVKHDRHQRAFASYASEDRDQVLGRLQGMHKRSPSLEIFLDVLALRSGQNWEQELYHEISRSDVFYLFWSEYARDSEWVDREWHCALDRRGIDFIDPVPLVDPQVVPPPSELASKHFSDWVLAFLTRQ
ncbi:Hsp70 family protein [Pirellulales bacterium]|nr:Hsp70 family protein [Pirellulales bacterium]